MYKRDKEITQVKNERILRFPLFYRMVMLICCIFSDCMSIGILIFQFEEWPYAILFFLVFSCPCLVAFILWSLWKVEIRKDGFIYRNYFGISKEYSFSGLEIENHSKGLKWWFKKNNKKIICIAYFIENGNALEKACRKYQSKHKCE